MRWNVDGDILGRGGVQGVDEGDILCADSDGEAEEKIWWRDMGRGDDVVNEFPKNSKNWDLRKSVSINVGVNAINEVEVSEGGVLAVIDERILEDQVVLGNRVEETGFGCDPVGGEIPASVDLNG
ncbi:hypothetical protein LWI28_014063 [Acer negundo]|uniref:Uncharacterized protein n=1 Tax=Acer negundo TaxID=4023 RepID=A0AAD5JKL4_ACENE|nr:hypothetical protein LWI28_014063 [Acer negundo]